MVRRGELVRVLIVTAGWRGDVRPFTGLDERLEQAGHQVVVAAHGFFDDLAVAVWSTGCSRAIRCSAEW